MVKSPTSAILIRLYCTYVLTNRLRTFAIADHFTGTFHPPLSLRHLLKPCRFCSTQNTREIIPLHFLRIASLTSVMSLLGGAECSTAVNPLHQFSKHLNEDQSLQRDRLTEHALNGRQESFRSQISESNQDEVNLALCDRHIIFLIIQKTP